MGLEKKMTKYTDDKMETFIKNYNSLSAINLNDSLLKIKKFITEAYEVIDNHDDEDDPDLIKEMFITAVETLESIINMIVLRMDNDNENIK